MRAFRIIIPILVGTSLTAAAPAAARDAAARSEPTKISATATDGEKKDEKLICKRFQDTTSRMKSFKACHTAEEWKRIDKER